MPRRSRCLGPGHDRKDHELVARDSTGVNLTRGCHWIERGHYRLIIAIVKRRATPRSPPTGLVPVSLSVAIRVGPGFSIRMPRRVPTLSKADFELLAEFRYKLRKFLGFSEAAAASHGVTPQQYQALLAIEGFPGRNWVTIGELAEQMQIAHHSAVGLVDRMQALRLVRRVPSKEDRRRVHVSLTAKGLALLEKLYRVHREELRSVGPQLIGLLSRAAVPPGAEKRGAKFSSPACSMPEIED